MHRTGRFSPERKHTMKILISRCLLGEPCRYDGRAVPSEAARLLREAGHTLVPVCPEVDGGLPTPRSPAERQPDGRVVDRDGKDVTEEYRSGARLALETARANGCQAAVLKARSPSCGSTQIYDGSFSHTLIPGQGVAAQLLTEAGIRVLSEQDLEDL